MPDEKPKDLYAVLGVSREADESAIRTAYRKLARRYHPDVNPGDDDAEDRFKQVSEAYSVLSDTGKRKNYDEFGEVSLGGGFDAEAARRARSSYSSRFARGAGGFEGESFGFGNLDDMLSDLFERRGWNGGPGGPRRAGRGADIEAELELDFLDAARGGEKRLSLARPTAEGGVTQANVTVRIPPGVSEGGRIRLAGQGGPGRHGGPPGDLYAHIRVKPHALFRSEGRDVTLDVPVSIREATFGATIDVPTLEGRVSLTIPAGTDGGQKLRLRGKGIRNPSGGPPGDLYAIVQIRVPRDTKSDAVRTLEDMTELDPPDLRKEFDGA